MKAVIFDMDGVIIDSESIHADMKIRTLTHFGIPCSMEDCVAYVGRSAKAFFTDFAKFATTPVSIQEMVDYKHRIYLEYIQESNSIYPIDGVLDLLYQLHSEGIPVALASSADRKVINAVLTKFGLMDCFEYILSGAELPASKPNPAIYQLTAKALGRCLKMYRMKMLLLVLWRLKMLELIVSHMIIQILAHKIYLVLIKSFLHYLI